MQPDEITEGVANLPISPLGEGFIANDRFIWEVTDGGAHFKVTRHTLHVSTGFDVFSVSVSGEESERERIIAEFTEVLGEPLMRDIVPNTSQHIDTLLWRA